YPGIGACDDGVFSKDDGLDRDLGITRRLGQRPLRVRDAAVGLQLKAARDLGPRLGEHGIGFLLRRDSHEHEDGVRGGKAGQPQDQNLKEDQPRAGGGEQPAHHPQPSEGSNRYPAPRSVVQGSAVPAATSLRRSRLMYASTRFWLDSASQSHTLSST